MPNKPNWILALAGILILAACQQIPPNPSFSETPTALNPAEPNKPPAPNKELLAPETYDAFTVKPETKERKHMVVTSHPLASKTARAVLRQGGNALDAAIAAQVMLTLVEPQSSGIGGGGFLLYYDAQSRKLRTFDGRETAPKAATPGQFLQANGKPMAFNDAVNSGKSVGVPGLVAMLEEAHRRFGRRTWFDLLMPTAALAEQGFAVSPRLSKLVNDDAYLREKPAARAYFYDAKGKAWPVGHRLANPALGKTIRLLAKQGSRVFYRGEIGQDIIQAVNRAAGQEYFTAEDLSDYHPLEREPLCGPYKAYTVCGMAPPSAGGFMALQTLGILSRLKSAEAMTGDAVHLASEASELAFADRSAYIADPGFAQVNTAGLLAASYLDQRAKLIDPNKASPADAGIPAASGEVPYARYEQFEPVATSHISVIDRWGNVASLTGSIENGFGSRIFVRGFLLNNQLTDFAFVPSVGDKPVANRVEPRKRPRSSMSPTLVFDTATQSVRYVLGSPGGSYIPPYVLQTLLGVLDWHQSLSQAVETGHFAARTGPVEIERGHFPPAIAAALREKGHELKEAVLTSGIAAIAVNPDGSLTGVADPRRECEALGD